MHFYFRSFAAQSEIEGSEFRHMAHLLDKQIVAVSQWFKRINCCVRQNCVNFVRELSYVSAHIEHCSDV